VKVGLLRGLAVFSLQLVSPQNISQCLRYSFSVHKIFRSFLVTAFQSTKYFAVFSLQLFCPQNILQFSRYSFSVHKIFRSFLVTALQSTQYFAVFSLQLYSPKNISQFSHYNFTVHKIFRSVFVTVCQPTKYFAWNIAAKFTIFCLTYVHAYEWCRYSFWFCGSDRFARLCESFHQALQWSCSVYIYIYILSICMVRQT
jgi:hypothetical protein